MGMISHIYCSLHIIRFSQYFVRCTCGSTTLIPKFKKLARHTIYEREFISSQGCP